MLDPRTESPPDVAAPTLSELVLAFGTMAISGFGGVMPWARRMIVEQRRWMTPEQFNEAFALCQFLPGPNIINFAVVFGSRLHGRLGAVAALAALLGPPMAIVILLGFLYRQYGEIPGLQRALSGVAAAAAGLIIATAVKMSAPLTRTRSVPRVLVASAVFVAIGLLRWPLVWVLLGLVPVSIGLVWWGRR